MDYLFFLYALYKYLYFPLYIAHLRFLSSFVSDQISF